MRINTVQLSINKINFDYYNLGNEFSLDDVTYSVWIDALFNEIHPNIYTSLGKFLPTNIYEIDVYSGNKFLKVLQRILQDEVIYDSDGIISELHGLTFSQFSSKYRRKILEQTLVVHNLHREYKYGSDAHIANMQLYAKFINCR